MQVNIANHDYSIIWNGVYYFALSDYPNITPWELKKLLMFMEFEQLHGRQTDIKCDDPGIMLAINNAIAHPETVADAVLPAKITECTACKQKGCLTRFVAHIAPIENAKQILKSGKLLSAVTVFNKTPSELVLDERNTIGDPADFFEYVMFAWGNCQAGDRLVMERNLCRPPSDEEQEKHFTPGVRFYFRHEDIICHPNYVFDGYHPAKVKNELVLTDYLFACIVPEHHKGELETCISQELAGKVYYLPQDNLGIWDWSERVYDFVVALEA